MKIVYGKTLNAQEQGVVNTMANECGILFDTARLMFYRGVDSVEKARAFLTPGKKGFFDAFKLSGMADAVARITTAKDLSENVLVFGDYDADGVTATTILYNCLKEFGIDARIYVPERDDGYGLNVDTVNFFNAQQKIDLLITVDCGISDKDKIKEINNLGIDVIVTDHHEPPEELPDCIKINPKLAGQDYPFTELCGAGVAYKLGRALIGERADDNLDLVALATVADSMDLVGENRDLVVEGLKLFNDKNKLRPAFKYLLGNTDKQITAQTLAYAVAPRVNAGGRMGDAKTALKLFTEKDENKIFDLAVKLSEYNAQRQTECDNIYREAKNIILKDNLDEDEVILVADQKWRTGFIGIVAAKLVEEFGKPVIVFAGHDGYYKGSCRSVDGFNIYDAINSVKDLLIAFGGHAQAAGVSVSKENFPVLKSALNDYAKKQEGTFGEQLLYAEWEMDKPFSVRFARELDMLEPFGVGNRKPTFVTTFNCVDSLPIKAGSPHYSFTNGEIELLDFNGKKNVETLSFPIEKKVVFELNLSVYKNRESLKGYVRNVVAYYGDYLQVLPDIFDSELDKIKMEKTLNVASINKDDALSKKRETLYVVSHPQTLKSYPELKSLPISLFTPTRSGGEVLIAPKFIPETAKRVVYLDKPLTFAPCSASCYIINGQNDYIDLQNISTDRNDFARVYGILTMLTGKFFKSTADFCRKNLQQENIYQAIFCVNVFLELGIFYVKGERFYFNEKVKNALTNSQLYSKIYTLKGLV